MEMNTHQCKEIKPKKKNIMNNKIFLHSNFRNCNPLLNQVGI